MSNITVIILTHNEEVHIARAIESVSQLGGMVHVVDSFSSDRTCELARSHGAKVTQHKFLNQAQQLQWALKHLCISSEWVLRLDADEILTDKLRAEMISKLPTLPSTVNGVYLRLRYIFMGRKLLYGGRSLKLLRLFRRDCVTVNQRWMDERLEVTGGRCIVFDNFMFDVNLKNITFFTYKHNNYSTREAIEVLRRRFSLWDVNIDSPNTTFSNKFKSSIKANVYQVVPFWLSPFAYFFYRYVILLGFLDGREGLVYHVMQGLWYRFLVGAKVEEYDRSLRRLTNRGARISELGRLTGYPLEEYAEKGSEFEFTRIPSVE